MKRGHAARRAQVEAPSPLVPGYPVATDAAEPAAVLDHAGLVAAIQRPPKLEIVTTKATLRTLIAADIQAANRTGRHGDAGALEVLAVRLGEVVNALDAARKAASAETAEAIGNLAATI